MVNSPLNSPSSGEKTARRLRSCLAIGIDQPREYVKALESNASAVFLSLGGSLDAAARARACCQAKSLLQEARRRERPSPVIYVRVAPVESEAIDQDLAALIEAPPDGFLLEEACGGASVQHLSAKIAVHEAETGLPDGALKILALAAQTPASIFALGGFAGASRRLVGLVFEREVLEKGLMRGSSPLQHENARLSAPAALARSLLVLGAAAAGIEAIDAFHELADDAGLRGECLAARREGFSGKVALSLDQVAIINELFA
jgi:citrate lyase subunit beta/citryl-CoA lyase